nr:hypothetical protein [Tanacetum cinerariifolium]
ILDGQAAQTIIPNPAAFQTKDLDAYNYNCNDVSNAKVVLMANLSSYGSDVLSDVPDFVTSRNDMGNQSVHAIQDFKQTTIEQQDLSSFKGTRSMVVLNVEVNYKQFVEEMRFDESFETDMDVMVERVND